MSSDEEAMISDNWAETYGKANTGVFWDVVDFPIPECDLDLISQKIKSALEEKGCYRGPVSIWLYEDEKNLPKKEAPGITMNFVSQGAEEEKHKKYARVHKMLLDILVWALDTPATSNLIILSKHLEEEFTFYIIHALRFGGYNVLLSEPPSKWEPFTESSAWLWNRLCESLADV